MSKMIFDKKYDADNLCNMDRDLLEAFDPLLNPFLLTIPVDENEMFKGTIKFTIEWFPCDGDE